MKDIKQSEPHKEKAANGVEAAIPAVQKPKQPAKGLKKLLQVALIAMSFLGIMAVAALSQSQKDDQKVPPQKKPVEEIRPSDTSDITHEPPAKIDTADKTDTDDVPAVQKCAPQRTSWTINYIIVAAITAAIIAVYVASVDWKPIPKKKIKAASQVKLNVSLTESNTVQLHVQPSQSLEDTQEQAASKAVTQDILDVEKEEVKPINQDMVDKWMTAAKTGNLAYLKSQSDKTDIDAQDEDGYTALIWSAREGHVDCVQYLVVQGANIEAQNRWQNTALIWSAYQGHLNIVQCLVKKGADINAKDNTGSTALMCSVYEGHVDCANYLRQEGAKEANYTKRFLGIFNFT